MQSADEVPDQPLHSGGTTSLHVSGLFLEAASWNAQRARVEDAASGHRWSAMPVVVFVPSATPDQDTAPEAPLEDMDTPLEADDLSQSKRPSRIRIGRASTLQAETEQDNQKKVNSRRASFSQANMTASVLEQMTEQRKEKLEQTKARALLESGSDSRNDVQIACPLFHVSPHREGFASSLRFESPLCSVELPAEQSFAREWLLRGWLGLSLLLLLLLLLCLFCDCHCYSCLFVCLPIVCLFVIANCLFVCLLWSGLLLLLLLLLLFLLFLLLLLLLLLLFFVGYCLGVVWVVCCFGCGGGLEAFVWVVCGLGSVFVVVVVVVAVVVFVFVIVVVVLVVIVIVFVVVVVVVVIVAVVVVVGDCAV
ncbi:unnamed protein product [Polarella glacialis]|uniref:Uncharacterized protein n=1 Tax=Polarella glacialis TaxID=89957 RepID=A0A813H738_POLGL|nr:unnamed protein product [Polarella glacialis]